MNFEGKIFSDGRFILIPEPEDDGGAVIAAIITVIGIIFFAFWGLGTIEEYGGNFVQYLIQYVFTNGLFYLVVTAVIVIKAMLFMADVSIIDFAILEFFVSFIMYIVWGCKAYGVFNVWETMKGLMLPIAAFFGIVWMALFFGVISVAICVGAAMLPCAIAESLEKRMPEIKTIKVPKKAPEQTVRDYLQLHTDKYGIMYDNYGDAWKCSFCGEWVSIYNRYCDKCTQKRLDTDIVKSFDSNKKKK